jgi:hypothetical protein
MELLSEFEHSWTRFTEVANALRVISVQVAMLDDRVRLFKSLIVVREWVVGVVLFVFSM